MPQINTGKSIPAGKPLPFNAGDILTAADLNEMMDLATLSTGAILDQTNIAAGTVASNDSILLYDLSATALREAAVSDVIASNLPIVTSSITAGTTSDIVITPNDGTIVTGQSYTSGDGLTVTVTSTAHTLTVGQVILVASAGTGYNGTFRVATIATNSFTYVLTTAATAGSGTLSYTKKGLVKNPANKSISGNLYVDGSTEVAGNQSVAGNLAVTGTSTFTGNVVSNGNLTVNGAFSVAGNTVQNRVDVAVLTRELTKGTLYILTPFAWTDIPYNTINQSTAFVVNAASFTGVLSSTGTGTITLPAGTYVIEAEASIQSNGGAGAVTARVYNNTSSSVIKIGVTTYCSDYSHGTSIVYAVFTLSTTSNISIQYYADVTGASSALNGTPAGTPEVVFISKITKLS